MREESCRGNGERACLRSNDDFLVQLTRNPNPPTPLHLYIQSLLAPLRQAQTTSRKRENDAERVERAYRAPSCTSFHTLFSLYLFFFFLIYIYSYRVYTMETFSTVAVFFSHSGLDLLGLYRLVTQPMSRL